MILQILNIVGGTLVASAFIKNVVKSSAIDALFAKVVPYEAVIGVVLAIFGVVGLAQRVGLLYVISGASFPQVLPLILVGVLLGEQLLERYVPVTRVATAIAPYRVWIGVSAVACGLGSLLFGCIYPLCFAF